MQSNSSPQPIGACAIFTNTDGFILLGKRLGSYGTGHYGLPGGHVEYAEPLATTITREIFEETGLVVQTVKPVGLVRETQPTCDFMHFVFWVEVADAVSINCEPEKCESWQWFDLSQLPPNILSGHRLGIELWQSGKWLSDATRREKIQSW
jgi:8-oxo-dGTP diphosphatase